MTTLAQPQACPRCRGRFTRARYYEGDEWTCTTCGHVSYGEGFTPFTGEGLEQHSLPADKRPLPPRSATVLQLVQRAGAKGINTRAVGEATGQPTDNAGNVLASLYTRGLVTRTSARVQGAPTIWFAREAAV